jgi:hypothetical protein
LEAIASDAIASDAIASDAIAVGVEPLEIAHQIGLPIVCFAARPG